MKKNMKKSQGFTLAELLIVVAIIAVLVAISIPVFSSQLEKARESTDAANLRSIYAELSSDVLTETNSTNSTSGAHNYNVAKNATSGLFEGTAEYTMTQQKSGTANNAEITIGGQKIASANFGTGNCTITVKSDGTAPTFEWGA